MVGSEMGIRDRDCGDRRVRKEGSSVREKTGTIGGVGGGYGAGRERGRKRER